MAVSLLVAPVGSGKTQFTLDRLTAAAQANPFARIWVLLPTKRQEDAFRNRLIGASGRRAVYFNIEFFSFYTLYKRLLDLAGLPQRELDDTARHQLLRTLLAQLQGDQRLRHYAAIAHTPGFVSIAAAFIYELKQNLIYPERFAQYAERRSDKDHDLALIYSDYQDTLHRYNLVDREGEGWLALDQLTPNSPIARDVALLIVDGFDQYNRLQLQLLAALAARAHHTLITLATVPEREATIGHRFARALDDLRGAIGADLAIENLPSRSVNRPPALRGLAERSFLPHAPPLPSDDRIVFIEAPDPAPESHALMRLIKRLLLTGARPDDVLIAVRDWPRYGRHLAAAGRLYGVPLALHFGEPLTDNPAVVALLNLLELPASDFRRRELLDTLRSPYFALPGLVGQQIDQLEHISRSRRVLGGWENWLEGITRSAALPRLDDDEDEVGPQLDRATAAHLSHHLSAFFAAVTPAPEASVREYIAWLDTLIGLDTQFDPDEAETDSETTGYTLHMLGRIRAGQPALVSRDLIAVQQFKRVLRSLLGTQSLIEALGASTRQTWPEFLAELKRALAAATIHRSPNRDGRVLVTTVADARGLAHAHICIPGLSEGIFPAPAPEDPLYLDSERGQLAARGISLTTQAQHAGEDGLYFELINLAHQTLILSRPTVQDGKLWPESHLWRSIRTLYSDADAIIARHSIRLGAVIAPEDAATRGEAALAVAQGLTHNALRPSITALYRWLQTTHSEFWAAVQRGRAVETGRMSNAPHDAYSGRLSAARLLDWTADELGARRVWSASQFNDYGQCGFRFFAKRLLRLEALKEPEEGMDAAQFGTLNHNILEETYRQLQAAGVSIEPEQVETAVRALHAAAARILPGAPEQLGFRTSAVWEQEQALLLRKLEALIRSDFSPDSPISKEFGAAPRQIYRIETPFGAAEDNVITIPTESAGDLLARGRIDRIDRLGDAIIVVDYKTQSRTIPTTEMERGRNFQMMLYLLAAQAILEHDMRAEAPTQVAGGLFWHIRTHRASGAVHLDSQADMIDSALNRLGQHIASGRKGDFAVHPSRPGLCSDYCEFSQLCRANSTSRFKRQG